MENKYVQLETLGFDEKQKLQLANLGLNEQAPMSHFEVLFLRKPFPNQIFVSLWTEMFQRCYSLMLRRNANFWFCFLRQNK